MNIVLVSYRQPDPVNVELWIHLCATVPTEPLRLNGMPPTLGVISMGSASDLGITAKATEHLTPSECYAIWRMFLEEVSCRPSISIRWDQPRNARFHTQHMEDLGVLWLTE
jgi:hypothetical protein